MELNNVSAVVTGGASGLGAATASMLAERGAKVAIFDINEEAGEAHAAQTGCLFVKADVTTEAEVIAGLDQAVATHGIPRVLVNCAGIAPALKTIRREAPHPIDAYRRVIEVNLIGTFIMLSRFAYRLRDAELTGEERGVIINTASIAAFDGQSGHAAYAASKAGIVGMTLPTALDLAPYAIRVMTIAPGLFATPMTDDHVIQICAEPASQVPHPGRFGKPEEFARLVESIILNPMLNGEAIRIDGALRLAPQ